MAEPWDSDSPLHPSSLSVGDTFGRYVIHRDLGRGDLGRTYVAHDPLLCRDVVLKTFDVAEHDARFRHAFRIFCDLERCDSANFGLAFDAGVVDGLSYTTRAYIRGKALSEVLRGGATMPRREAIALVARIATALHEAHSRAVLHLNLKPSNIVLNEDHDPVILDFSLWHVRSELGASPTQPNLVFPSDFYKAPELLTSEKTSLGPRSDIYSLGVILYDLLFDRLPLEAPRFPATARLPAARHPAQSKPTLTDAELEQICIKATARDESDRFSSMHELAVALGPCLAGDPSKWYVRSRGRVLGPFDLSQLEVLRNRGQLATFHEVSQDREVWSQASSVPELYPSGRPSPRGPAPAPVSAPKLDPPTAPTPRERPIAYDDDVQFTVYRPHTVRPGTWHDLLAFAHLSRRRPDAAADERDPAEEVRRQAERLLAERIDEYRDVTQDSQQSVPREGEITFLPEIPGFEFNPPRRVFRWVESVHSEHFRFRASEALDGTMARGRLTVFLGGIIIAEATLSIRVDRHHVSPRSTSTESSHADHARTYRKIFASYSHKDTDIVRQFELFARTLGDEYLRDGVHLRSGQDWNDELKRMIHEADIFQLFWSSNAMRSRYVRDEWEYALSLGRSHFVRPTYWEDPLPSSEPDDLPPADLRCLHFQRVVVAPGGPTSPGPFVDSLPPVTPSDSPSEASFEPRAARPPRPTVAPGRHRRGSRSAAAVAAALVVLAAGGLYWATIIRPRQSTPMPAILGSLRLELADPELTVSIDGRLVGAERLRASIQLPPGSHRMEVRRGNDVVESRTLEIRSGRTELVSVAVPPVPRRPAMEEPLNRPKLFITGRGDLPTQMNAVAAEIKQFLDSKGRAQVAMGEFRGAAELAGSSGAGISKALADALAKRGVTVARRAEFEVEGEFREVVNSAKTSLAVAINFRVLDGDGDEVLALAPRGVDDVTNIAALIGLNGTLPPDVPEAMRNQALVEAVEKHRAHIEGARIGAAAGSPYAIEILVGDRPRVASLDDGSPILNISQDETYKVKLINNSSNDVGVALSIDGLNVLAFNENSKARFWIVQSHQTATISGWYLTNQRVASFNVTQYAQSSLVNSLPGPGRTGTITAIFAAAWPKHSRPPRDELAANQSWRPNETVGAGDPRVREVVPEFDFGVPRAAVSVRYTRGD